MSPFTHGSQRPKRQIKTNGKQIAIYLTGKRNVEFFSAVVACAINTFTSPHLSGIFPFELVSVQKPPDHLHLVFPLLEQFADTHKEYLELMKEKAEFMQVFYFTIKHSKCKTGI